MNTTEELPTHCDRCKGLLPKEMILGGRATWYGRYEGFSSKPVEIICRVCWDRGERWDLEK